MIRFAVQKKTQSGPLFLGKDGEWRPEIEGAQIFDTFADAKAAERDGGHVFEVATFKETTDRNKEKEPPVDV